MQYPGSNRPTHIDIAGDQMGIWLELGVFLVVLAFGFWQLHDVKKAIRERESQQTLNKSTAPAPTER
jgi:hypothetical protein